MKAGAALTWERIADPAPGSTFDYDSLRGPTRVNFAVADGVPYLAVLSRPSRNVWELRAYRTVRGNSEWRQIDGLLNADVTKPVALSGMATIRGRVYISYADSSGAHVVRVSRNGRGFEEVDRTLPPASDSARVGKTLYTFTLVEPAPEAPNIFTLYATRRGVTEEAPNPTVTGNDVTDVHLTSSGGTLWMLWIEGGPSAMAPPRIVHVAKLVRG